MGSLKNRKLVIQAILKSQKRDPNSSTIELNINSENKLNTIPKTELSNILYDLECKEWVIRTVSRSSLTSKKKSDFTITILQDLQNWYSAYLLRIKRKLQNLPPKTINKLSELSGAINESFQKRNSTELWVYTDRNHAECLEFLHDQSVLSDYTNTGDPDINPTYTIRATLNVDNFIKFDSQIKKFIQKQSTRKENISDSQKMSPSPKASNNQILYKISFPLSKEIKLNNKVLAKPQYDSENFKVFSYLMENPNKTIKKSKIQESIGKSIGKDFHKIIENLGFKKDLRKIFFIVSKDTIFFRNPVTKVEFDKFGIPRLKITKK